MMGAYAHRCPIKVNRWTTQRAQEADWRRLMEAELLVAESVGELAENAALEGE